MEVIAPRERRRRDPVERSDANGAVDGVEDSTSVWTVGFVAAWTVSLGHKSWRFRVSGDKVGDWSTLSTSLGEVMLHSNGCKTDRGAEMG